MKQHESNENVDSRIHAFLSKQSQKPLSVVAADWFHAKFGDRKESLQSHEPVTWARYER